MPHFPAWYHPDADELQEHILRAFKQSLEEIFMASIADLQAAADQITAAVSALESAPTTTRLDAADQSTVDAVAASLSAAATSLQTLAGTAPAPAPAPTPAPAADTSGDVTNADGSVTHADGTVTPAPTV
jgi:hypothetical protein